MAGNLQHGVKQGAQIQDKAGDPAAGRVDPDHEGETQVAHEFRVFLIVAEVRQHLGDLAACQDAGTQLHQFAGLLIAGVDRHHVFAAILGSAGLQSAVVQLLVVRLFLLQLRLRAQEAFPFHVVAVGDEGVALHESVLLHGNLHAEHLYAALLIGGVGLGGMGAFGLDRHTDGEAFAGDLFVQIHRKAQGLKLLHFLRGVLQQLGAVHVHGLQGLGGRGFRVRRFSRRGLRRGSIGDRGRGGIRSLRLRGGWRGGSGRGLLVLAAGKEACRQQQNQQNRSQFFHGTCSFQIK